MKAKMAFMYGPCDLRVEEVEVPQLKPDQVRGQVVQLGTAIQGELKVGDKVTGDCVMACGVCRNCKDGLMPSACLNMRDIGFRPDCPGGMGKYMVVEEQYVHAVPDDWSFEDAAWVETFSIGYFGIWDNDGFIDAGDRAVIFGAGPVGLSAAMVAKTSGAQVIMVDPIDSRRKRSLEYGADNAVDPTGGDLEQQIMDLTGGEGASVCVEASGNDNAIASLFDVSGQSARIRLIGHSIGRKVPVEIGKTIWKTVSITDSGGTRDFGQRTIRFMSSIKDRYDFAGLNTHHFPFSDLHQAFDVARHNKEEALKVMLTY